MIDGAVGTIEPDRVGQIRRTDLALASAVVAMTVDAGLGIDLLALLQIRARRGRKSRERAHIVRHRLDVRSLEDAVAPEGRHTALPLLALRGADAIADGERDILKAPAPEPFVVEQIRIALGAAAATTVARRAVFQEHRPPLRAGELRQILVRGDLCKRRLQQPFAPSDRVAP